MPARRQPLLLPGALVRTAGRSRGRLLIREFNASPARGPPPWAGQRKGGCEGQRLTCRPQLRTPVLTCPGQKAVSTPRCLVSQKGRPRTSSFSRRLTASGEGSFFTVVFRSGNAEDGAPFQGSHLTGGLAARRCPDGGAAQSSGRVLAEPPAGGGGGDSGHPDLDPSSCTERAGADAASRRRGALLPQLALPGPESSRVFFPATPRASAPCGRGR